MSEYGTLEITFELNLGHPCGGMTIYLSKQEVDEYRKNPRKLIEKKLKCSFDEYREWVFNRGEPPCAAVTKKGLPCKNYVRGGVRSLHDYLAIKRLGWVCPVHEKKYGGGQ